jgi:hypothetical protein
VNWNLELSAPKDRRRLSARSGERSPEIGRAAVISEEASNRSPFGEAIRRIDPSKPAERRRCRHWATCRADLFLTANDNRSASCKTTTGAALCVSSDERARLFFWQLQIPHCRIAASVDDSMVIANIVQSRHVCRHI